MRSLTFGFALLALVAGGCQPFDETGVMGGSTRSHLAEQRVLELTAADSRLQVTGQGGDLGGTRSQVEVLGGHVALQAPVRGGLILGDLAVDLDDIVLTVDEAPPSGLRLTGVRLSLAGPVNAEVGWSDSDDVAYGRAFVDLLLEWALVDLDGDVLPLAPQAIRDVDVYFTVQPAPLAVVAADLRVMREGTAWEWAGLFSIRDVDLVLHAEELGPAAAGSGE